MGCESAMAYRWELMTYCLGILVKEGLVLAADSRTNAGVDYISSYRKLFDFSKPGDRVLLLCTSGNLSITQAVVHQLSQDIKRDREHNLHNLHSLYDVARYLGDQIRVLEETDRAWLAQDKIRLLSAALCWAVRCRARRQERISDLTARATALRPPPDAVFADWRDQVRQAHPPSHPGVRHAPRCGS